METIFEWAGQLSNPDWIMDRGGLYLVLIILFVETGLFFGFFLPGDPLLFISGMIIAGAEGVSIPFDNELSNLAFWGSLFVISTIIGNAVGYWSGYKFGHIFTNKKKGRWLLKPRHIHSAGEFYEKRGGFAILIARFLPVARTFVPIVGGIVKMDFRYFMLYNVLGAVLWVGVITTLGFVLGENRWVENNLGWVILGLVLIVTAPVMLRLFKKSQNHMENA